MPLTLLVLLSLFAGFALFVGLAIRNHAQQVARNLREEGALRQKEQDSPEATPLGGRGA